VPKSARSSAGDLVLVLVVARDADVKRVVDERLALGLLHPRVGGITQRAIRRRYGEVDHGGDAAACAGARARAVIVGGHGAAERQLEMDMDVEHAGDNVMPGGVHDVRAAGVESFAQGGDLFADDANVAGELTTRGNDVSVSYDAIEFHVSFALALDIGATPGLRTQTQVRSHSGGFFGCARIRQQHAYRNPSRSAQSAACVIPGTAWLAMRAGLANARGVERDGASSRTQART